MLIEDAGICQTLRKIVRRLSPDPILQDDLMQECLLRLWKLEREAPGRTRSWYLQNCRFHLQHWLASGRSVDSPKRATGDNRITLDGVNDELIVDWYHTNGELFEIVSTRDILSTLTLHLKPRESAVLGGLADGLVLHEIAVKLNLSYPTALKYRRKIAALTVRLGISPPPSYKRDHPRPVRQLDQVGHPNGRVPFHGVKHHNPLLDFLRPHRPVALLRNGRTHARTFKGVARLRNVRPVRTRPGGRTAGPSRTGPAI